MQTQVEVFYTTVSEHSRRRCTNTKRLESQHAFHIITWFLRNRKTLSSRTTAITRRKKGQNARFVLVLAPLGDESDVCVPVYFANIWESVQFHMIKNLPVLLCVHLISIHTSVRQNIFQLGVFWTNFDHWTTIGIFKNDDSRSSTTPMLFSENPRWPPYGCGWEWIFDFLRAWPARRL